MDALKIVVGVVYLLVCVATIIVVMIQDSKSEGVGVITGGSDTFFGKGKSNTKEGFLNKLTIVLAVFTVIVAVVFGFMLKKGL